jgi:mRNA interferase MazF
MITYNLGDIVLIGFPHTDLQGVSKRPAIVLYDSGDQDVLSQNRKRFGKPKNS